MTTEAGSVQAGNPAEETVPAGQTQQPAADAGGAQTPETQVFSGLDADMRSFAENKGWTKDRNPIGAVLKSYRELESRLGNSVTLPAEDDAEGWRKIYGKLGMPETAEGYELNIPEQHDPGTVLQVKGLFHEAGLSKAQAARVYDKYMEMVGPELAKREEEAKAREKEAADTVKEIGEARLVGAKAAFSRLVGDNAVLAEKIERIFGDREMILFFDKLGQTLGEDANGALGIRSGDGGDDKTQTYRDIVDQAYKKQGA